MMNDCLVSFEQIDTWFFRESRPYGSVGANALNSVFPPPTRTLMGAIRNYIGTQYFANHSQYSWDNLNELNELKAVIGNEKQLGTMRPKGVFLQINNGKNSDYYLPAPVNICQKTDNEKNEFLAFALSEKPYQTDIGNVYLPTLPENARGAKPLENRWISVKMWEHILNGNLNSLSENQICELNDFMSQEYRLGIELQVANRGVKDGQLYQTTHLRLKPDVSVAMAMSYDENALKAVDENVLNHSPLVRLGGESRMASVKFNAYHQHYLPNAPKNLTQKQGDKKRFMLYFVSKLSMQTGWLPQNFAENSDKTGFDGTINGIAMTVISACMGKVHREGGWNQLEHKPRAITNFLPVGSAWFVEVADSVNDSDIINALHGQVFNGNEWGEGLMLVGKII